MHRPRDIEEIRCNRKAALLNRRTALQRRALQKTPKKKFGASGDAPPKNCRKEDSTKYLASLIPCPTTQCKRDLFLTVVMHLPNLSTRLLTQSLYRFNDVFGADAEHIHQFLRFA